MKSFHTFGAACLACTLSITAAAHGQGIPGGPSYSGSQSLSNTHFAPAAPAQLASTYRTMPAYPAPQAARVHPYAAVSPYAATAAYQPSHYANYALPATPTYAAYGSAQPSYWPASTPQTSVMLHNGSVGGPTLAQPRTDGPGATPGYGPAPATGYGTAPATGYGPAPGYGTAPAMGYGVAPAPNYGTGPAYGYAFGPTNQYGYGSAYGYGPGAGVGYGGGCGYGYAEGQAWTDAYGAGYTDNVVSAAPRRGGNWFATASGLFMTRDRGHHYTFSFGTLAEEDQRTNTRNAEMDWTGGYDLRFGRYFNCGRNAIEAVYWGVSPENQSTQTTSADVVGNLNAILNFGDLNYGGVSADNFVNVAPGFDGIHRLRRGYDFQNIEVNVWQFCTSCGAGACDCSRFRFNWLAGVRYFRFDENLLFGSDANDWQLTFENDEIYYNIDVENSLVGFQLGNELEYCINCNWTLDMGVKLGIYGNRISHTSEIGGAQGVATINNGPFAGDDFYVRSSKKDVAFLGEARVGLQYCFNSCWTATVGYRAFAVTGVALTSEQIYPDLRGINDVAVVDSNSSLLLHGGYAGLEYCW